MVLQVIWNQKREENQQTHAIFYYYQDSDKVGYKYITYGFIEFEEGDQNQMMGHYNFILEKYLG